VVHWGAVSLALLVLAALPAAHGRSLDRASIEEPDRVDAPVPPVEPVEGLEADPVAPEPRPGHRELTRNAWIYPAPRAGRDRRGRAVKGEVVVVIEEVDGPGCRGPWGRVVGDGFLCLDHTVPTGREPEPQPRLVRFDSPEPGEFWEYVETGEWDRSPDEETPPLVPWIYGKRWRRWQGVFYDSVRDYERYEAPSEDQLDGNRKYHFAAVVETARGPVLQRTNGQVVPMDGIHLYPVPRFTGRDLAVDPLEPGTIPGWVHGYDGSVMRTAPDPEAEVGRDLEYHEFLVLDAVPADEEGRWWRVPGGLGEGVDGFVSDMEGVRRWSTAPPPADVTSDRLWVDIDVRQQILTAYEGLRPVYITLVSTGKKGTSTPLGTFRIFDKMATVDMISRPEAPPDDQYHVEAVPWSMHFYPRYALHGAYWHWGFGNRASHGCVNLSPADAKWLYDRLDPALPDGWHTVYEDLAHPGALVRVRYDQELGRERRKEPGAVWRE
jgi:hypothetical protein